MASATAAEQVLFRDGVLTFEEYESAVAATMRCIEEAGLTIAHSRGYGRGDGAGVGPRLSSRGVYSYEARGGPVYDRAANTAVGGCKATSAQVEFMWAQHTSPSDVELQAMRNHMAACLAAAGVTVRADPSDLDLRARKGDVDSGKYRQCQFAAADAFEIDRLPG